MLKKILKKIRKPKPIYKILTDYKVFVEDDTVSALPVEIIKGPYRGLKYVYFVKTIDCSKDDCIKLDCDINYIEIPDGMADRIEAPEFQDVVSNILNDIITTGVKDEDI